jgi:hypothetical protein
LKIFVVGASPCVLASAGTRMVSRCECLVVDRAFLKTYRPNDRGTNGCDRLSGAMVTRFISEFGIMDAIASYPYDPVPLPRSGRTLSAKTVYAWVAPSVGQADGRPAALRGLRHNRTTVRLPALLGFLTAITVVLAGTSTRATPPPDAVQLAWVRAEGAESCADSAAIARDVVRRLGRDPFRADATRRIEGMIARDGARWIARMYFRDSGGALTSFREIDSGAQACDSLSAAVGLAVALGIDPNAPQPVASAPVAARDRADPAPTLTNLRPAPASMRQPAQRFGRRSTVPTLPRLRGLVRAHGGGVSIRGVGVLGALPTPSPGGMLALDGYVWGPVRWNAGALVPAGSRLQTPNTDITVTLIAGWLEACFEMWPHDRLAISACAGGAAGIFSARSKFPRRVVPSDAPWAGPLAGLRASIPIVGPLALDIGAEGVLALANPNVGVEHRVPRVIPLFQPSALVGLAYVGAGVQF